METKSCAIAQAFMLCNWWDKYLSIPLGLYKLYIKNLYFLCLCIVYYNTYKIHMMLWQKESEENQLN